MARLIEKRLKEKVAPLDDNEMRMLRENVRQPYLLGAVLKTNDQLVAARKAAEAIVTPDPRPLTDLTDGEEIFRKIVYSFGVTWTSTSYVPALKSTAVVSME